MMTEVKTLVFSGSGLAVVWLCLCLGPSLPGQAGPQCPEYCSCMWRRGKEAVVCRDTRFTQIPANIAPNTQVSIMVTELCRLFSLT